jgi:hypothetical protein
MRTSRQRRWKSFFTSLAAITGLTFLSRYLFSDLGANWPYRDSYLNCCPPYSLASVTVDWLSPDLLLPLSHRRTVLEKLWSIETYAIDVLFACIALMLIVFVLTKTVNLRWISMRSILGAGALLWISISTLILASR